MALGKFAKPAAAPKGAPKGVKKSRYAGIEAATPRDPMPHVGTYRFAVVGCVEGLNPGNGNESFKATLQVLDADDEGFKSHNAGDTVTVVFLLTGKGGTAGLGRTKSFVMAAAGFEDESAFDAFDDTGEFIDSVTGTVNAFSEAGHTIVGRVVDCKVTRGNATPDGDYYREYAWAVVADDEPEQAAGGVPACASAA
jgi:hypothetical protein